MELFKKINWKSLFFNMFMPIGLSLIVTMLIGEFSTYYDSLNKLIEVPSKLFPIIWTVLYLLMGLAAYLISEIDSQSSKHAYYIYWISLLVNIIWPVLFFGFELTLFSAIWLMFLVLIIVVVLMKFKPLNKISFYLMIPYFLWSLFALFLNISIYILNK